MSALTEARVILVAGPGGVGKTTLAASLGLQLALQGHRTLVLTVDPARRLAQALGLTGRQNEIEKVVIASHPNANLAATMLDTEHYFDRVIARFAKSPIQRDRILKNRLYRVMVESLGGSHEYAAMERLLEFAESPEYDRIVVDTPPTHNALDLLRAPERLAAFMDNSVLRWFRGGKAFSILSQGTRFAFSLLQKLLGGEFLANLAGVLNDLEGMEAGFRERNLEVIALLKKDSTAFWLTTVPSEARFQESLSFAGDLKSRGIALRGIWLNRILSPVQIQSSWPVEWQKRAEYWQTLTTTQNYWTQRFRAESYPICPVPETDEPPTDLAGLLALGSHLIK